MFYVMFNSPGGERGQEHEIYIGDFRDWHWLLPSSEVIRGVRIIGNFPCGK